MNVLKNKLLYSALILTAANFLCRGIGFFYRIFISQALGEESMGVLQLVTPILAFSYALCCSGFQTTISKLTASYHNSEKKSFYTLLIGSCSSFVLASLISLYVFNFSEFLASQILLEKRCACLLRILSLSFPFSAFHSCINGYFYGVKKSHLPAILQVLEQSLRVSCIIIICLFYINKNMTPPIVITAIGTSFAEFCITLISSTIILTSKANFQTFFPIKNLSVVTNDFFQMVIPLSISRVIVTFLQSIENIYIPEKLRTYGLTSKDSLSVYGVLTGMSLSVIFLPCSLVNSIALLLLPKVAEAQSIKNQKLIQDTIKKSLVFCVCFGSFCSFLFFYFGQQIGLLLFHSEKAGNFIYQLSLICPFLYISSALGAILHGLGKNYTTLFINITSVTLRILFVFYLIPKIGISGYIIGLIVSQTFVSIACICFLRNQKH